ncbi:NAD(+) diphosphatase [Streptococcus ratti]|uniref:NAD(+) diphosphatase n=1 Tax=Streptococcus ratti TaxID=1341 RepID=A0A7X9QHE2_STRRT|nr:NUDIX domain-containing protein [Streptococcus ratti]NMD49075.1 NUDIX domain-containing protein [Streptococcus ratti]
MTNQKFCTECGRQLQSKFLANEGFIPYCDSCQTFRFPVFNTACSMIVQNEAQNKILLIKQYSRPDYILVAGYISQGESAEAAVKREIKEETGLKVTSLYFNQSQYFEKSNTLMLNFAVTVSGKMVPNSEIDDWAWFDVKSAKKEIKDGSLAEKFLLAYLEKAHQSL